MYCILNASNVKLILGCDKMVYPNFICKGNIIGVCAPSSGIVQEEKVKKLNLAVKKVNDLGYQVLESNHVRTNRNGVSCGAKLRAKELEELYNNEDVKVIICATGGEFLLEMLSFFDFSCVQENIKWLQGYSDPTGLLFTITTGYDIATIYGNNFAGFGMNTWHESLQHNFDLLEGNLEIQKSFSLYESGNTSPLEETEGYMLDTPVKWKNLGGEENITFSGRMIGGCIDILRDLFGTRFDHIKEFINKYKNDGIVWYFDNCELSCEDLVRTLWKFKDSGWFLYCKGIIFGRTSSYNSYLGLTLEEAINRVLGDYGIPIIIDSDFGHVPPRMTIINGSFVTITFKKGKGTMEFFLK